MKITLDLPEMTVSDSDGYGDPYYDPGVCGNCAYERSGNMVKLVPYGWVHADGDDKEPSCLQSIVNNLPQIGAQAAWLVVAQHVAKYPSRHSASAIRAVLMELMKPAWKLRREANRPRSGADLVLNGKPFHPEIKENATS